MGAAVNAAASRRIVVVTAVHAPSATYLPEAHRSLCDQELPYGWEWHWVIREDGTTDEVSPYVPDDPRVTFRQGRRGGPGVARTIALAHAEGEYVKVLDADDQLTPGALARDLAALDGDPAIGWATSRDLELMPDGSTIGFPGDPADGPVERGTCSRTGRRTASGRRCIRRRCAYGGRCCSHSGGGWRCRRRRTPGCCWRSTR